MNGRFKLQGTPKKTQIKLYSGMVLLILLCGSENWTVKARDARIKTTSEMKCVRNTAGNSLTDYKTDTEIAK